MASFTRSAINAASGNAVSKRVCLDLVSLLFSILHAKERERELDQTKGLCIPNVISTMPLPMRYNRWH